MFQCFLGVQAFVTAGLQSLIVLKAYLELRFLDENFGVLNLYNAILFWNQSVLGYYLDSPLLVQVLFPEVLSNFSIEEGSSIWTYFNCMTYESLLV